MVDSFVNIGSSSNTIRFITYGIVAMILSIAHLVFLDLMSFGGVSPDFLILLCIWITLHEGQFIGLFFAFGIGLLLDIVSFDVVGTNALAKTVAAFIAGLFYYEGKTNKIIGSFNFLGIVFLSTLAHNLVYFFFYIKPSELFFFHF